MASTATVGAARAVSPCPLASSIGASTAASLFPLWKQEVKDTHSVRGASAYHRACHARVMQGDRDSGSVENTKEGRIVSLPELGLLARHILTHGRVDSASPPLGPSPKRAKLRTLTKSGRWWQCRCHVDSRVHCAAPTCHSRPCCRGGVELCLLDGARSRKKIVDHTTDHPAPRKMRRSLRRLHIFNVFKEGKEPTREQLELNEVVPV